LQLRERLGLSQEKFAALLKVSLPSIQRWEAGRSRPDPRARYLIEELLRKLGERHRDLHERYFGGEPILPLEPAPRKSVASRRGRRPRPSSKASESPTAETTSSVLDVKSMETLLWKAACSIRGEKDAPKFKDFILPLIFIKRLSDVFEDEIARLAEEFGNEALAREMVEADHELVRFYIPAEASWPVISGRRSFEWPEEKKPRTLGEHLTTAVRAIAKANPSLQGVIDIVDFNETRNGEREVSDAALSGIIELLSNTRYRLGLKNVEPDFLGRAYEYLLRKFAEGQGQSAGEFFTPTEVGWLIAHLVRPVQGEEVYDPCCGSGGLLIKCELALAEREKKPVERPLKLYGQELTGSSFAIARMNMVLHDMQGEIVRGNTMTNPKFSDGPRLKRFDTVVTNPMWNQDNFDAGFYEKDPYERFTLRGGYAPGASADWGWFQHVHASLSERGRSAVVIDTGAASRGSGSQGENREKAIRRWFVEQDLIDGVILLPDNLFYNTTAAGLIVLLNNAKTADRKGKVVLINASGEFQKGRPKNFLPQEAIRKIAQTFHDGRNVERFAKAVSVEEIAKNDFNLSPSRYVESAKPAEHRDIQEVLDELSGLEGQAKSLDGELKGIFERLGYRWGGAS